MDNIEKGEVLTLDDNKEYCVIEIVEQPDGNYLYLVNTEKEVIIGKYFFEGEDIVIDIVDDTNKVTEITNIVKERLSKI